MLRDEFGARGASLASWRMGEKFSHSCLGISRTAANNLQLRCSNISRKDGGGQSIHSHFALNGFSMTGQFSNSFRPADVVCLPAFSLFV